MPRPMVTNLLTTGEVRRHLHMTEDRLRHWLKCGALPPPSFIDNNGVRYFDQEWLRQAEEIVNMKRGVLVK